MFRSKLSSVPKYLEEFKTASVQVYSLVVDEAPDIAVCNSAGYFLEIKGEKVVNTLNLNNAIGYKIDCFYICENEQPFIVYVVKTKNKLLVIKRLGFHLEIVKVYWEVKNYEIDDFNKLGYPQLKITYKTRKHFIWSPVNTEAVVDQSELEADSSSISKLLAENLQVMCRQVDELAEDWNVMKRLQKFSECKKDFKFHDVNSLRLSLPVEEYAEKIAIVSIWMRMMNNKLILGINISYNGEKKIPRLEFKIFGKEIMLYSYKFFSHSNSKVNFMESPLFPHEKIDSSILPGEAIIVVGAVILSFHNSLFAKEFEMTCYLASAELKNYLMKKTFQINISDLFDFNRDFFNFENENFSVEVLQVIKTVKSETKFKIKINNCAVALVNILKDGLNFNKVDWVKYNLYYCNSAYLSEVFIVFQPQMITKEVWKFNFYASNVSQVNLFMNALHELLPEGSVILLN